MDVKSFALGYNAGASQKGGNVSQAELEAAIKAVVPEWALEENPPKVDADPAGTAQTLVNDLARKTAQDLANYYTKSQTLSTDEINTLVSAIPKFDIEVVTSLPASNISETTVYLVKSGDDDTNLYTEYIRVGGKWEKLGTQTVDLTGYATEAWVNTLLAAYVKTADMEAYVAGLLKSYLTPATGDQRYAAKQATEDALEEHGEKIAVLEKALENATIESADSVEWLNANGDTAKKYSLPDGYVYAYMQKLVDVVHNANDGKGTPDARCGTEALTITDGVVTSAPVITQAAAGCFITWPIDVKPESKSSPYNCTISGIDKIVPNYYDRLIYLHYYKTDGTCITFKNDVAIGIASAETALPLTIDLAAPIRSDWDNVRYIRVTIGVKAKNTSITASDIANLVINIPALDHTETVWGWYSTGVKANDDTTTKQNTADIADLKERMDVVEEALGSGAGGTGTTPLFAKLGLIGDSLTAQVYQGWQELTVSMLGGPELHKNAIVGSCVATYEGYDKPPFVERYLDTPEDCNCIVIMGGTNDATYKSGNDMGAVGVLNNNTYKGAYSTIIEGLLTRNPATRVMLITPPRSYTTNYEERTVTKDYADATKEIAKFYGLPCLDFYDTLGWNAVTAPWCARDFTGENTGSVDTLHFSDEIGPRVGRMVANFIRQNY